MNYFLIITIFTLGVPAFIFFFDYNIDGVEL